MANPNNPLVVFVEQAVLMVLALVHHTIDVLGYGGIVLLMAIESANVPLPSEMILPYAGYLVQQGQMNFHLAALAGAIGCVVGSIPCYWLGYWGGPAFLRKYGKWILLTPDDITAAEAWTRRFGDWAFFLCRMLPIVRTFISVPAGVLKARFWPFVGLTFVGSLIWSYLMVWVGVYFGENLHAFKEIWHQFDLAIAVVLLVLGVLYVWKHVQHLRQPSNG